MSLVFAKVFGGKVFKLITHPGMVFPVGGAIEHYYTNNFSFKDQEGNTRGYTPLTSIFRACSGDIHPGKVISGLVAPYRVSREIIEVENADIDYRSYKKKLSDLVSSGQITLSEYEAQIKKSQNLNESIRKEVFERPFFPHLSPKK